MNLVKETKRLLHILGFSRQELGWYRDLALLTIAGIALLWTIIGAEGLWSVWRRGGRLEWSDADLKLTMASALVAFTAIVIGPNRALIAMAAVGIVALRSWIGFFFTWDARVLLFAVASSALVYSMHARFGGRRP